MGLLHGLWLLVLGALGASSLVAKREEGRKALAALEPYQGWIGVLSVVWGVWGLFQLLVGFRHHLWLVSLADAGLLICLGLLLGVGVIQSFLKDPDGRANFDKLVARLTPYRQTLGVVAMVLGGFLVLGALF
jgi:glucan phosphoethanolaminetransferase (alkaline phosphatase superfamily)